MYFKNWHLQTSPRIQAAAKNSPPLQFGEKGKAVAIVQQSLKTLIGSHYLSNSQSPSGIVDGHFGNETRKAVRAFQEIYGFEQRDDYNNVIGKKLAVDGKVGRRTLKRIDAGLYDTVSTIHTFNVWDNRDEHWDPELP